MSELYKNVVKIAIPTGSPVPAGGAAYSATEEFAMTATIVGTANYLPITLVTTSQGVADMDPGRIVRLCTESELQTIKDGLWSGASAVDQLANLILLLRQTEEYGKPVFLMPNSAFIAVWVMSLGKGFHMFKGYDQYNYPTQTVTYTTSPAGGFA